MALISQVERPVLLGSDVATEMSADYSRTGSGHEWNASANVAPSQENILSLPERARDQADGDFKTIRLSGREARDAARLLTRLISESPELVDVILKSPSRTVRGHRELADRKLFLDLAKRALFERQQRSKHLTKAIFGEPAWDVLLVLYIAESVGGKQTIGNVASLVDVPLSTVVRWVRQLEREDLAIREPHPHDRRMVFVRLGERGREVLDRYFSSLAE